MIFPRRLFRLTKLIKSIWKNQGNGCFRPETIMIYIGPISSIFDIATYLVMWYVFKCTMPEDQALFQSGWFIEGLLSQI